MRDAFAYGFAAHTAQSDPRNLRTYTEEEFRQLEAEAAFIRERNRVASLSAQEWADEQLAEVAKRYGPNSQ